MKISRDTFIARCRAALGDLPQSNGPRYLFEHIADLECLLSRPQADSKAHDGASKSNTT